MRMLGRFAYSKHRAPKVVNHWATRDTHGFFDFIVKQAPLSERCSVIRARDKELRE